MGPKRFAALAAGVAVLLSLNSCSPDESSPTESQRDAAAASEAVVVRVPIATYNVHRLTDRRFEVIAPDRGLPSARPSLRRYLWIGGKRARIIGPRPPNGIATFESSPAGESDDVTCRWLS